jgi:hypothetical protein
MENEEYVNETIKITGKKRTESLLDFAKDTELSVPASLQKRKEVIW